MISCGKATVPSILFNFEFQNFFMKKLQQSLKKVCFECNVLESNFCLKFKTFFFRYIIVS